MNIVEIIREYVSKINDNTKKLIVSLVSTDDVKHFKEVLMQSRDMLSAEQFDVLLHTLNIWHAESIDNKIVVMAIIEGLQSHSNKNVKK